MIYLLLGLLFGLFIPYMARRFEKFMPATAAYAFYRILKPNRTVSKSRKRENHKYIKLMRSYIFYSIGWAIATATISYLAFIIFGHENIVWHLSFMWILLLLFEIDKRMFLLPDILTIPLLVLGFTYAALTNGWVVTGDSAMGAFAGYFLPVFASILLVWKNKDVFGGGDIKLLTAIGAWVGLEKLLYVIILSCIIFTLYAIINRRKEGAFGPAIVIASMIITFLFFRV